MKIFKAMVGAMEGGMIYKVDVIEYEEKLWLVPHWLDAPAQGVTKPARLIRMDTLAYQKAMLKAAYGVDFVLNAPLPKALLEPTTPKQPIPGFEVRELPELEIPISDRVTQSSGALQSKPRTRH